MRKKLMLWEHGEGASITDRSEGSFAKNVMSGLDLEEEAIRMREMEGGTGTQAKGIASPRAGMETAQCLEGCGELVRSCSAGWGRLALGSSWGARGRSWAFITSVEEPQDGFGGEGGGEGICLVLTLAQLTTM
jgi:hypothetical protein